MRTIHLRRELALRQGEAAAPDEVPGPVDYDSPETLEVLEAMFIEKFGQDELMALKGEETTAEAVAEEKDPPTETPPQTEKPDPGPLGEILFARLEAAEPVETPDLIHLARTRSENIKEELAGPGELSEERIEIKSPAALDPGDPPKAILGLDVVK